MTARRYLLGVALVTMAGAGLVLTAPGTIRTDVIWGVATGLILQAPLGWWALRSIGRDEFMLVWAVGMLVRLTVVGLAGLALIPVLGLRAGPTLGSMVGVLVALLLVEVATAAREHS